MFFLKSLQKNIIMNITSKKIRFFKIISLNILRKKGEKEKNIKYIYIYIYNKLI